jgi:citrate lyase beta subunit
MPLEIPQWLADANRSFAHAHPGDSGRRQPIHCVYGGAHLFRADVSAKFGSLARRALADYAPDPAALALALQIPTKLADTVYARVQEKLQREPIEDFHIDFEDGYGFRPDAEEDAAATAAAQELATGLAANSLPPFMGIRVKPLNEELADRSARTLERFLTVLLDKTGGKLPEYFAVTLPKVTVPEQVRTLSNFLEGFAADIRIELMVETPSAIFMLPQLISETRGRCSAVHFGPYDYSASLGISATVQDLHHPACVFARQMMQASVAGTGVWMADGPTTIMPVPLHRGATLAPPLAAENRAVVHRAWKLHGDNVRRSLEHGFFQSWDLHPAQLVSHYATTYSFFLEGLDSASERLRNFIDKAAQATMVGDIFDDAATGQGLLNYFLRAVNCGAIPESEAPALAGLTIEELRSGSFAKILSGRGTGNASQGT